jgi:hypothetical protein
MFHYIKNNFFYDYRLIIIKNVEVNANRYVLNIASVGTCRRFISLESIICREVYRTKISNKFEDAWKLL